MRSSFAREVITRLRYPAVDDHGTTTRNYQGTPDRLDINRCWLEPTTSTELNVNRAAVETGYSVDAPAGADILSDDHVLYRDVEYEVDGQPMHVPSPTGALTSTRLQLKRWEG